MITIENTQECFVQLWLQLERTRRLLTSRYKRYCIRNILKDWFGTRATDDFIWEVCNSIIVDENDIPAYGWDVMPPPKMCPWKHRELLRAIVAVALKIGIRKVDAKALNKAYEKAFPQGKKLKSDRKKKNKKITNNIMYYEKETMRRLPVLQESRKAILRRM